MWPYLFGSGWQWGVLAAVGLMAGIIGVIATMFAATAPSSPDATMVRQLAEIHRFRSGRPARTPEADADVPRDAAA